MPKFARLTGYGQRTNIGPEAIAEAERIGLGADPHQLSGMYNAIMAKNSSFVSPTDNQPIGGVRVSMPTELGEPKPAALVGADHALVATELLLGRREPMAIPAGFHLTSKGYDNSDEIPAMSYINRPFFADIVRDRPYLAGFLNVLNITMHNLELDVNFDNSDRCLQELVSGRPTAVARNTENNHVIIASNVTSLATKYNAPMLINPGTPPDALCFVPGVIRGDNGTLDITNINPMSNMPIAGQLPLDY